jgi:hypothetical protein
LVADGETWVVELRKSSWGSLLFPLFKAIFAARDTIVSVRRVKAIKQIGQRATVLPDMAAWRVILFFSGSAVAHYGVG